MDVGHLNGPSDQKSAHERDMQQAYNNHVNPTRSGGKNQGSDSTPGKGPAKTSASGHGRGAKPAAKHSEQSQAKGAYNPKQKSTNTPTETSDYQKGSAQAGRRSGANGPGNKSAGKVRTHTPTAGQTEGGQGYSLGYNSKDQ